MSGKSSKQAEWWSVLEPAPAALFCSRGDRDDPRLGEVVRRWEGQPFEFQPGQAVLLGFPCDEGVRRNRGRLGAALAPDAIREQLYRLTPCDPLAAVDLSALAIVDLGNLRVDPDLAKAQNQLGEIVAALLHSRAVPVLLGGGHETAFGHFLGYAGAGLDCSIINVDAHLDVRSFVRGPHSGSPFRQAMEHPTQPLKPGRYVVIGAQRQSVAQSHWQYVQQRQSRVHWLPARGATEEILQVFADELTRLASECEAILLTVDADAFRQADVPGCSAPSPVGLPGVLWPEIACQAGCNPHVSSIDLVEINPRFDRDAQSARWGALGMRQFLVGLVQRKRCNL